jgi:hypothetical protein
VYADVRKGASGALEGTALNRVPTHRTATNPISRVVTSLTARSKRENERLEPEPIPVTDLDRGVIGWEGQDDPDMPLNFPQKRK